MGEGVAAKEVKNAIASCKCGGKGVVIKKGSSWKVVCERNADAFSGGCRESGHFMFSKRDAIKVWNEKS